MTEMTTRHAARRRTLSERQRAIRDEMWRCIRTGRTSRPTDVADHLEQSDADIQADLDVALLQMRAEALARITDALARFDAGEYGSCVECGEEIAERRLRVLPFAVRCLACEARREQEQERARRLAQRGGSVPHFSRTIGS